MAAMSMFTLHLLDLHRANLWCMEVFPGTHQTPSHAHHSISTLFVDHETLQDQGDNYMLPRDCLFL
jgi:hypothetical protein